MEALETMQDGARLFRIGDSVKGEVVSFLFKTPKRREVVGTVERFDLRRRMLGVRVAGYTNLKWLPPEHTEVVSC